MIRALLYEHDVLVDGTHSTKKHIQRMFEIDNEAEFFFVDTPPSICKHRAIATGQRDLVPVIDRITDQLMELTNSSYWDDVCDNINQYVNPIRLLAWEQVISD